MPTPDDAALAKEILGPQCEPIELGKWSGWVLPGHFNPEKILVHDAPRPGIPEIVLACHKANARLFKGWFGLDAAYEGHGLYMIPEMPVLEVARLARVGAHNAIAPEAYMWNVQNVLRKVYEQAPFEITFADEAGLEAFFLKPVPNGLAELFSNDLSAVSPETTDLLEYILKNFDPSYKLNENGSMVVDPWTEYIHRLGRIRLWVD